MRLRPHQREAVSKAVTALTVGRRASVVMACGTGKTLVAAAAADRLAADGRTIVYVPTLDLLLQTIREWHRWLEGRRERVAVVAVCSDKEAALHGYRPGEVEVTTSPRLLAGLLRGQGRAVAVCTYASAQVVAAAHADHDLPDWHLMVVDEAHRTAGTAGKPWALVHEDSALPARRRLYLTATPRVYTGDGRAMVSMDDETVFGPQVYRLSFAEAIKQGLLADYRVVVPVVTDAQVHRLLVGHEAESADLGLVGVQVALLRAAARHGLRRVLSYHSRVVAARQMVTQLPRINALLPESERAPRLWARWMAGTQTVRVRREILAGFAADDAPERLSIIANARVLGEGVDLPDADAVVFSDPKTSAIDSIQAVGRALRTGGRAGKVATIVVPVFVGPHQDPEEVLDSSAYRPLWMTLRALRAHDERINADLTPTSVRGDVDDSLTVPPWITLEGIPQPRDLALAIQLHTVPMKSVEWRTGYAAARRWYAAHGHLLIPQSYVDDRGVRVGAWLAWQRHLYRCKSLPAPRIAALEALGMVWEVRDRQWERGMAAARAFHGKHGHLAVGIDEVVGGVRLGVWLRNLRNRPPSPERRAQLAALDPLWDAPWPLQWRRALADLRAFHAEHGHCQVPRTYITPGGRHLGEWVYAQREHPERLDEQQRKLLDELGFDWQRISPHERSWQERIDAARRFRDQFGHVDIPQSYVTPEGIKLGVWVNNVRRRWDKLSPERQAQLLELGLRRSARSTVPKAVFRAPTL